MAQAYDNPALQKGNGPSHVERGASDTFITGSTLLADNPQLLPMYFRQRGAELTTLAKISLMGMGRMNKRRVEGPITGHYEKPRPKKYVKLGTVGASANAQTITVALDASEMENETDYAGNTTRYSRPRVSEVYSFGNRNKYKIIAKDITVNPHTITLQSSIKNSSVAAADIVSGAFMFYIGTVSGEATGQPTSLQPRQYKYQNTFWICKETNLVSGTHQTTKVSFEAVKGSNLLYMAGVEDEDIRHQEQKSMIWIFGSQADNWADYSAPLGQNVNVPGTKGLLDYALENGFDDEYDPASFTEDDIYGLSSYFNDTHIGSNQIMLFEGYNASVRIERALGDKLNYTWVAGVSDKYMQDQMKNAQNSNNGNPVSPESIFINMGISGFNFGGYDFMRTKCPEFSNAQGAGKVGFSDWVIAAPFGVAGQAENTPYLGYEWRGTEGYERENEVWMTGGAGAPDRLFSKASEFDVQNKYFRSEIAPHFALGEQFAVLHPQAA